jgi:hypothetical protein
MIFAAGAVVLILTVLVTKARWRVAVLLLLAPPSIIVVTSLAATTVASSVQTPFTEVAQTLPMLVGLGFFIMTGSIYTGGPWITSLVLATKDAFDRMGLQSLEGWKRLAMGVVLGTLAGGLFVASLFAADRFWGFRPGSNLDSGLYVMSGAVAGALAFTHSRRFIRFASTAIIALILGMVASVWSSYGPQSDLWLKRNFAQHQEDFERLVAMANEDRHMSRIADNFVDPASGISPARWEEYRSLFRRAEVVGGITRKHNSADIEVGGWGSRFLGDWKMTSYLFCGPENNGLTHSAPPCVEPGQEGSLDEESRIHSYEKIARDWYIYGQSW